MKKAKKKLWGGTFGKGTDPRVEAFTDSTRYESRLVPYDIEGSVAHATMLGKVGILKKSEASQIVAGLKAILKDWEAGRFKLDPAYEDVHGNVEARLRGKIGALAGKLHTGRSRNDQVALDERLYLRDEVVALTKLVNEAKRALLDLADGNAQSIMPGYTHLQRAQPVLFAHWCMAYVEMLRRDRWRLAKVYEELDECPLGAGALAGSSLPLDRQLSARLLGFSRPTDNSIDTVSNRDYLVDFASSLALIMAHLSRLGEEITLYCSQEFGFLKLDDAFATGSSLMPQKKNPDVAELLRGRAGRSFGLLMQLLTMIKGQPLAYNRDMQEDKESLFDTIDMVESCLKVLPPLLAALTPDPVRMLKACQDGYLEATDAADYLVRKGVPFREAHGAVGSAVRHCQSAGLRFKDLSLGQWRRFHPRFDEGIFKAVDLGAVVASRSTHGGTSPGQVRAAIRRARTRLEEA